jgi:hypothetical protein
LDDVPDKTDSNLASVWLDVLAFAIGLGVAWYLKWQTTDLVWSLWLSSLVVGYAMIVNNIFGPVLRIAWSARPTAGGGAQGAVVASGAVAAGFALLAFFTFHFGFFHLVHSVFLNTFFPVTQSEKFPDLASYLEIFRRYWYFIPAAAIAERHGFRTRVAPGGSGVAVTAGGGDAMTRPYRNVIRMHLLIFFFVLAHFLALENFAVYAVVYAVYFFPWRVLRWHWHKAAAAPAS